MEPLKTAASSSNEAPTSTKRWDELWCFAAKGYVRALDCPRETATRSAPSVMDEETRRYFYELGRSETIPNPERATQVARIVRQMIRKQVERGCCLPADEHPKDPFSEMRS